MCTAAAIGWRWKVILNSELSKWNYPCYLCRAVTNNNLAKWEVVSSFKRCSLSFSSFTEGNRRLADGLAVWTFSSLLQCGPFSVLRSRLRTCKWICSLDLFSHREENKGPADGSVAWALLVLCSLDLFRSYEVEWGTYRKICILDLSGPTGKNRKACRWLCSLDFSSPLQHGPFSVL